MIVRPPLTTIHPFDVAQDLAPFVIDSENARSTFEPDGREMLQQRVDRGCPRPDPTANRVADANYRCVSPAKRCFSFAHGYAQPDVGASALLAICSRTYSVERRRSLTTILFRQHNDPAELYGRGRTGAISTRGQRDCETASGPLA
jgi:hypothetical protein